MYINVLESPQKQRFEKAHKLSYFIFNHNSHNN